jgi:hypothetical protein
MKVRELRGDYGHRHWTSMKRENEHNGKHCRWSGLSNAWLKDQLAAWAVQQRDVGDSK